MALNSEGILLTVVLFTWASCQAACPSMKNARTYRINYNAPPNCEKTTCDYSVAIATNSEDSSFLDFVLEGNAQGWVAIGFSINGNMPDADVLACALNPSSNNVEIIDTYNAGYTNIRDTKQDVCPHFSNYTNGRITCSFSRAIDTGDKQDKILNEPYHLMYGASNKSNSASSVVIALSRHNVTPGTSPDALNPAKDTMLAAAGDRPVGEIKMASTTDETDTVPPTPGATASSHAVTNPAIVEKDLITPTEIYTTLTVDDATSPSTYHRSEEIPTTSYVHTIPTTITPIIDHISEEHTTSTTDGPTKNPIDKVELTIPTTITPIIDHISEEHTTSTTDGPTKNPVDKVELTIPTTITPITNHISEEHTTSTTDGPTKNPIDKVELTIPTTITPIINHISEEHTTSTTDGPTKNPIDKVELTIPTTITPIPNHISEEHTTSTTDAPTKNPIDKVELTIPTTITPITNHISEEHTTSTTDGPTKNPIDKVELTIPTTITPITNHISEEHTTSTTDGPTKNPIDKVELTIPTTITPITNHISEEHTTSTTDGPTKTPITEMGNTIPTTSSSTIGNIPGEYTASTAPESQMSGLEQNTTVSSITSHTSVKDPILETLTSSKPTSATTDVILTTLSSPTSEHSTATTFHPTNDEHTDPTTSNLSANPTLEIEHTFPTEMSSITSYTSTPKLTSEVISSTQLPGPTTDEMSLPIVPSTDMSITAHVPSIATQMGPTQATNTNMHSSTGCPSSITLGTNQHEFKKTFPSHCNRTTCDYYISIQTNAENPHFLDFVLEASAQGWVAIGFSSTPGMRDADVLACALHPNTKSVVILDTYNTPRGYNNVEDSIQNVCPYSTNFSDGRISCIFSRAINTVDPQDKDLSKDYYHLYGAVDDSPVIQDQVVQLSYHSHQTPTVSDETVNIIPIISISSTEATSVHGSITSLPSTTSSISSSHVTNCPPMPPAGAQYRLQITLAPNCAETRGCGYFMVGVRTNDYNSKYLDFVMEGDAQGWIAIGFSPEKAMPDADVLACALNPSSNNVEIIDTYNAGYTNIRDTKQDVCPHFSNYTNGRITCSFSRAIDTGDKQDKILNEPYHLMYGAVDAKPNTVKPNTLLQLKNHGRQVPMVTTSRVNPAFQHEDLNAEAYPIDSKRLLVLSHGILMLVAWPLVATVGIFFASWMKPALPKGAWFQVHRSFMTISLVVAACAFILIFIANKDGSHPGLIAFSTKESIAHFAIGVLVMFLHIANPLISVARCAPDAPRRWIFNITHGSLIGVGAYLLALVNVAIGIFVLEKDQHQILWVYVALVGFLFTLLLVLFVVFTVIAARSTEASKLGPPLLKPLFNKLKPSLQTKSSVAMVDVVSTPLPNLEAPVPQQAKPKDEKKASKDAPLRWTGFIILLAVMLPMVGVIGIKIALIDLL